MLYRNNNHFINCSYYSNNDKIKLSKNREGFMNKIEIDYKKTLKLVIIAIIAYWILNHYQIVLSLLSKLLSVLMPFIIGCMIAFVLNVLMIRIEKQLSKVIVNPKLKIEGILRTMFDNRNRLSSDVSDELKRNFDTLVYETIIPRNVRLAEAPSFGKPAMYYDKSSMGSKAYMALAHEILQKDGI